jgi:hypothetical protein
MNLKLLSALAAVPMMALAGAAVADEAKPVALDEQQLDGVTAAGSAFVWSTATALGASTAATFTGGLATVAILDTYDTEAGGLSYIESYSQGVAASASNF